MSHSISLPSHLDGLLCSPVSLQRAPSFQLPTESKLECNDLRGNQPSWASEQPGPLQPRAPSITPPGTSNKICGLGHPGAWFFPSFFIKAQNLSLPRSGYVKIQDINPLRAEVGKSQSHSGLFSLNRSQTSICARQSLGFSRTRPEEHRQGESTGVSLSKLTWA